MADKQRGLPKAIEVNMASAEQLLREIHSESLQQLLREDSQAQILTGIPALDSYLSLNSRSCLRHGDAIHLQGPPGSGKTHLLYFLLGTCIMPSKCLSSPLEGWNKVAFVFDMDGTFSVRRFHEILVNRLQEALHAVSIEPTVESCMKRLHVFRPTSSEQLVSTLAHLSKYHAKHFPDAAIGAVAIHSIDAYYWLDRFKAEQLRGSSFSNKLFYEHISQRLEGLRRSHGAITLLTYWGLPHNDGAITASTTTSDVPLTTPGHDPSVARSHLPDIPLTCRISLNPDSKTTGGTLNEPSSLNINATVHAVGRSQKAKFLYQISNCGVCLK